MEAERKETEAVWWTGEPPKKRTKGPREIKTLSMSWKMEKQTHDWTCNEKRMSENRDNRMVSSARARPSLGKTYLNTHNG